MRSPAKNQVKIWYALRNVSSDKDEWGNTENVTTYSSPKELKISLSSDRGEAAAQVFGADLQYDREMSTHDMSCPIDEYSRLWIDEPSVEDITVKTVWTEGDTIFIDTNGVICKTDKEEILLIGSKPHNYEVAAVSRSLNCIRYAIRRVDVSK